ncbi:MAG: ATP synthase F1 subunit epsilon [Prochloraceae cyanobacterium]
MSLQVRVIAPDKIVWDDSVEEIILPSSTGQLGILTGHAPLLTALEVGVMRVRREKKWESIAVMGGFAEVEDNEIKVLVNAAEMGDKIDLESARSEYEEAQKRFAKADAGDNRSEKIKADRILKKTRARFQAAGGMVKV